MEELTSLRPFDPGTIAKADIMLQLDPNIKHRSLMKTGCIPGLRSEFREGLNLILDDNNN